MSSNKVDTGSTQYITNNQLAQMVIGIQNKVSALMVTNGIFMAAITAIVVERFVKG